MAPRPIQTRTSAPVTTDQVRGPSVAAELAPISIPKVQPADMTAPWGALADFGAKLSDIGNKIALPEMADRGSQAVTRDPATGELSVQLRTPFNDLDVAYNHAAQAAFATQSEGDRRGALQKLAIDNMDNPALFNDLATKYVKQQAGGDGVPTGLRGDILNTGLADVTQFTADLVTKKQARDTKTQLATINTGIDSTKNDIYALAHNGGTQTPEFQDAVGKLNNQYGMLANPVFGVSAEEIHTDIEETLSSAEGEATLGHALATAKAKGTDAGLALLDKAIWSTDLNLTPAQRQAFVSRGKNEINEWDSEQKAKLTEFRQSVEQRFDDANAAAEATGNWTRVVTPGEIERAYPKDPAKAADVISKLNASAATFSMRKQVQTATPAEIRAMNEKYDPINKPVGPNTHFADDERTYSAFVKSVQERNQALTKDPAAYVGGTRQDIATGLQSNDAGQFQTALRSSLQAQRDLGVQAPRLLSDSEANSYVGMFANPQDKNRPADGMNATIDGLAARYGTYFPQVMGELQRKGMPPEAASLYAVRGMGVPAVRMATAINSMSKMGKDINEGRSAFFANAPGNSDIRKDIPGVMGHLADSNEGNPEGPASTAAMTNAVSLYARQLAYEGVPTAKAAQMAHDDLIGSRYNFVDSYRVPKGIDQSMISAGAGFIKSSLVPANMEPYANAAPGVSVDDRKAMTARILQSQGRWITRSDDKGLSLVWPQGTGYLPALDAKGNPISMSWAALQKAGQGFKPNSIQAQEKFDK